LKEKLFRKKLILLCIIIAFILILNACQSAISSELTYDQISTNVSNTEQAIATEQYIQTLSSYLETLEHQATWTPQPTYTLYPTPTIVLPSPTSSVISSDSFPRLFSYFKSWINYEETYFYFLNAYVKGRIYGTIDGNYDIVCDPDPLKPVHMICVSDNTNWNNSNMEFIFYADESKSKIIHQQSFSVFVSPKLGGNVIYHRAYDCPDRGKNVWCESEYRLYDGKCYYAHTCYDDCGLYYSLDNIPDVWNEFQGYTDPCN